MADLYITWNRVQSPLTEKFFGFNNCWERVLAVQPTNGSNRDTCIKSISLYGDTPALSLKIKEDNISWPTPKRPRYWPQRSQRTSGQGGTVPTNPHISRSITRKPKFISSPTTRIGPSRPILALINRTSCIQFGTPFLRIIFTSCYPAKIAIASIYYLYNSRLSLPIIYLSLWFVIRSNKHNSKSPLLIRFLTSIVICWYVIFIR